MTAEELAAILRTVDAWTRALILVALRIPLQEVVRP
jgi:hypothetical protein